MPPIHPHDEGELQMHDWRVRLGERKLLIASARWNSELVRHGLPCWPAPERWNLERADLVRRVAESYVAAGADIILANTLGGNTFTLARAGLAAKAARINWRGIEISRQAAGDRALVFGSMGPTGELMEPIGEVGEREIYDCYVGQARALAEAGADGILIEAVMDLREALCALRATREHTSLSVVVSMMFDRLGGRFSTVMGAGPAQAAAALDREGADMVGATCGSGMGDTIEVIHELRSATSKPLWASPNVEVLEHTDGHTGYDQTPEMMARLIPPLAEAGAHVIGGCGGTTAEHIGRYVQTRNQLVQVVCAFVAALPQLRDPDWGPPH